MTKEQFKEFWKKNQKKIIFFGAVGGCCLLGVILNNKKSGKELQSLLEDHSDWDIDTYEFQNGFAVVDSKLPRAHWTYMPKDFEAILPQTTDLLNDILKDANDSDPGHNYNCFETLWVPAHKDQG